MFNPDTVLNMEGFESGLRVGRVSGTVCDQTGRTVNPGFKYNPNIACLSTQLRQPTFSLGSRRDLATIGGLVNCVSTPANVGPDSYRPSYEEVSRMQKTKNVRFPREMRFSGINKLQQHFETYVSYSSLGTQSSSVKKTERQFSVGKCPKMSRFGSGQSASIIKIPLPHAIY